jgi:hypothetical protein
MVDILEESGQADEYDMRVSSGNQTLLSRASGARPALTLAAANRYKSAVLSREVRSHSDNPVGRRLGCPNDFDG